MGNGAGSYLRFQNGERDAFAEIVEEYKDGLLMFINSFVNDYHIAEETVDEAFVKLYVKKPKYKPEYPFRTWLYTIARNTAVDYLRKLKRGKISPIEDYYYITDEIDIEAQYIKDEEHRRLHKAIRGLKEEYAQVLYLVYFEGLTNPEAARIMGKSDRQISDLIYRAKQSLRAKLGKEETDEQL